jgi:arginine deiminase
MLNVTSEIGRLRRVLVHEPGPEVDRMVPAMMDELLFDDILFGDRVREEHGRFRRLMQLLGVEVVEVRDLLEETLAIGDAADWLRRALGEALASPLDVQLFDPPAGDPVSALIAGVLDDSAHHCVETADLFHLPPLPNWCFQRDPQVIIGSGVVFGAMATEARWREGLLARCVFRFHPSLRDVPVILDPLASASRDDRYLSFHRPCLEGGDVLVLSEDVVAVGLSERTNSEGIEALARALKAVENGPRWLEIVHIPHRRAYMHLDTVFTQIDRDAALVFPPVVDAEGPEAAEVFEVDLRSDDLAPRDRGHLVGALAGRGVELQPIACGGGDPLRQQREQWTDGANALALAPGVIILYDRNPATADELGRHGFEIVHGDDVLLGRREVALEGDSRVCLLIDSHEICRARGGPHCLSHPLVRDPI